MREFAAAHPDAIFAKYPWPEEDARYPVAWNPLRDGDIVRAGDEPLAVLHTPGHSPDHVVFWHEASRTAFTGDLAICVGSASKTHWGGLRLGWIRASEDLLGRLEQILEMTLQTGRVRRVHGAESEQSLLRLFHQTSRGSASRRATEAVNRTLATLAGQTIATMLFTSQGHGVYRLGLETDRVKLTLEIDRHGVTVESLEV